MHASTALQSGSPTLPPRSGGQHKLRLRIFIYFMAGGLFIISASAGLTHSFLTRNTREQLRTSTVEIVQMYERQLQRAISNEILRLRTYHQLFGLTDAESLLDILTLDPRYNETIFLNLDGRVLVSRPGQYLGYDWSQKPLFLRASQVEDATFDIDYPPHEGNLLLSLILRVRDRHTDQEYIALHRLNPVWFEDEMRSIHLPYRGDAIIYDTSGIVSFRLFTDPQSLASVRPYSLLDFGLNPDQWFAANAEPLFFEQADYLYYIQPIAAKDRLIAARTPLEPLRRQQKTIISITILLITLSMFSFSALGMILGHRILKPIRLLADQVGAALRNEQEAVQVPNSELNVLAVAFNQAWADSQAAQRQLKAEKQAAELARLTAEQARQAAEAANLVKTRFLANMSHELRTPMNAIIGLAHLAEKQEDQNQSRDYLRKIESSSQSLLTVINDIINYSRLESGITAAKLAEVNIRESINQTVELFREQLSIKGLDCQIDTAQELPELVVADSFYLKQILTKLLDNAIKFTEAGMIRLSLLWTSQTEDRGMLAISVEDEGVGIPAELREHLFTPFFQADTSSTRRHGGTGLGLALVRQMAEAMNGSVDYQPAISGGSRFTVRLPIAIKPGRPRPTLPLSPEAALDPLLAEAQILLVEDNPINVLFVKNIAKHYGLHIQVVADGASAMRAIDEQNFSIICLDLHLPDMDGTEISSWLRVHPDPCKNQVPVIAISADTDPDKHAECIRSGMNGIVIKPFQAADLIRTLRDAIHHQPLASQCIDPDVGDEQHLNSREACQRLGNDTALYATILKGYRGECAKLTGSLQLRPHNDKVLAETLHKFKGLSGNVGAERMYHLIRKAELYQKKGWDLDAPIMAIQEELKAVEAAIVAYLQKPQPETAQQAPVRVIDDRGLHKLLVELARQVQQDLLLDEDLLCRYASQVGPGLDNLDIHQRLLTALRNLDYQQAKPLFAALRIDA